MNYSKDPKTRRPEDPKTRLGERLRTKRDFDRVFREGKARHTARLTVHLAPNGLPHSRLGLVVRKTSTAVRRNRTKRLLREAFRLTKGMLVKGCDVVLIPRRGARLELEELAADLKRVFGSI